MSTKKSSFVTPLIVTPIDDRRWCLQKPFFYHIGSRNSKQIIKVPAGFITDFASTDVLQWVAILLTLIYAGSLWWLPSWVGLIFLTVILSALLITPYGRHSKPAVLHDFLYKKKIFSRHMADLIFYEAMLASKTAKWKAKAMYTAVRMWGWLAWR